MTALRISLAVAVLLGIEAIGFWTGGVALIGIGFLLGFASLLVIFRVSLYRLAFGTAVLATALLPWNGWLIGPVRPGDLLILLALVLYAAADAANPFPRLPTWVTQVGVMIVVVAVLHEVLPPDTSYLSSRIFIGANGQPLTVQLESNSVVAGKFLVAVLIIPLVFLYATRNKPSAPRQFALAFAVGSAISGLVAFTDGRGLTQLGPTLTGLPNVPAREAGFSMHPNFMSNACALSLGFAIWIIANRPIRRARTVGWILLLCLAAGIYASGSRGGAVGALVAIAVAIGLSKRYRRQLAAIVAMVAILATAAFILVPGLGQAVLTATRLSGDVNTSGSDYTRSILATQGVTDWLHSPFYGIGLQVAADAQNVYLQELASGGILLFVAMQIYYVAALRVALRLRRNDSLGDALVTTVVVAAALNAVESSLTDRFYYVPTSIIVAATWLYARPDAPPGDREPDTAEPPAADVPASLAATQ